jgi:CHASE2 domain-containing sensor protein
MAAQGSPPVKKSLRSEILEELIKAAIVGIPMLLLGMSVEWLKTKLSIQPGQALWLIIPAILFLCLFFLNAKRRRQFDFDRTLLVFLVVYILVFFMAAETGLFDWKRSLVGYEKNVPRNFLALNSLGDWHYRFAKEEPANKDLVVILMKTEATVEEGRLRIADLIQLAQTYDAKGVALDFYFEDGPENKGVDELLCSAINSAKKLDKPIPVFVAYDYRVKDDRIDRMPIDPDLRACVPDSNQGHAIGYAEWDGKIRSIPLYFQHDPSLESLSLKVAKALDPQIQVPDNGLLQFTKPEKDFPKITLDQLEQSSEEDRAILRSRFILVGEDSPQDSFSTPYGVQPGVVIHANAIHSLRQHNFIIRAGWWVTLAMIFLLCYLNAALTYRRVRVMTLISVNLAFSLLISLISALSMYIWLTWIDLVYPLVASWLFLLIVINWRRIGMKEPSPDPIELPPSDE